MFDCQVFSNTGFCYRTMRHIGGQGRSAFLDSGCRAYPRLFEFEWPPYSPRVSYPGLSVGSLTHPILHSYHYTRISHIHRRAKIVPRLFHQLYPFPLRPEFWWQGHSDTDGEHVNVATPPPRRCHTSIRGISGAVPISQKRKGVRFIIISWDSGDAGLLPLWRA